MVLLGENTHVFIVRIWCEPREIEGAPPEWRGVIEHVFTGERCSVDNLSELRAFISKYVTGMDVELGTWQRLKQWLSRRKLLKLMRRD
jgi:hypothetical protein